jgi:hypothetical protein
MQIGWINLPGRFALIGQHFALLGILVVPLEV